MALKFLNKKGWHTGSLRNIENVWKAEQKHGAEQKKLEELRKQIQEERERSEFWQLQEQAGLVPRQERLDFLYESGLAVGKGSEGFKALEAPTTAAATASSASADASSSKAAVPGALFGDTDKPQAANDAWRKLHSDPLLQIRQREQEALARIKNNPIQMAMIRKSAEAKKNKKDDKERREKKRHKRKHHHKTHSVMNSDSENTSGSEEDTRKRNRVKSSPQERIKGEHSSEAPSKDVEERRKSSSMVRTDSRCSSESEEDRRKSGHSTSEHHCDYSHSRHSSRLPNRDEERRNRGTCTSHCSEDRSDKETQPRNQQGPAYNRRKGVPKMTEEEREARLREMQMDAELHEEQRWKRIKKAADADAKEAAQASSSRGNNFLDEAQKSIYGAEKGGSSTIEESVRRRAYYSQGGSSAHESNAFRR